MPQRGFSLIVIVFFVCLIILSYAYFALGSNKSEPVSDTASKAATSSADANPFSEQSNYANPFSDYENPFEELE